MLSTYIEDTKAESLIKSFLDIIVLSMLNGSPLHGYKIIANLHRIFGVLLSPGTLYPLLYNFEGEGLITVEEIKRTKQYTLTPKGRRKVLAINSLYKKNSERIFKFVDNNLANNM